MEILKLILQAKYDALHNMGQLYMLWWVSCTTFSGTVIAGAWLKRKDLAKLRHIHALIRSVYLFFGTVIFFGLLGVFFSYLLLFDTRLLLRSMNISGGTFLEFHMTAVGIFIGTTTFILFFYIWRLLAANLLARKGSPKGTEESEDPTKSSE